MSRQRFELAVNYAPLPAELKQGWHDAVLALFDLLEQHSLPLSETELKSNFQPLGAGLD